MKRYKFAWLLLIDPQFRYWLKTVLVYALTGYDKLRGTGASDVLYFDEAYAAEIFTARELERLSVLKTKFKTPADKTAEFSRNGTKI